MTRIGRYTVGPQIGRGGMGLVYRGHDPSLDRPVAIKVLRQVDIAVEARLRDEARTLADLDHPNIVKVYDVGTFERRTFVVMPLIEGEPLGVWTRARRPDSQRQDVLMQIGRGIAAAHRAGILHRDIKPANVIVTRAGQAVVLDFGLGRALPVPSSTLDAIDGDVVSRPERCGTPGYVAPEQAQGGRPDTRADIFSYCVTAIECLCGRAPTPRRGMVCTPAELDELLRQVPSRWRVPLRRGVQHEAHRRPDTMDALLDALSAASSPTSGRGWMWGAVGLVALAGWALPSPTVPPAVPLQPSIAEPRADPDVRRLLAQASRAELAGDPNHAIEHCTQAAARASRLEDTVGEAQALLVRGRLRTLVGDLEPAESDFRQSHALAGAAGLSAIGFDAAIRLIDVLVEERRFADAAPWLRHAQTVRSDQPNDRIRWSLAAAAVDRVAGRLEAAVDHIEAAHARLSPQTPARLRAEVLWERGVLLYVGGDPPQAMGSFNAAAALVREQLPSEAMMLGTILSNLGAAQLQSGDLDGALATLQEARVQMERVVARGNVRHARVLANLAITSWRRGELDDAIEAYQGSVDSFSAALGPSHPEVAQARENLSTGLFAAGRYDEALVEQHRALVILQESLGAEHMSVARTLNYIAQTHEVRQQWEEATTFASRARALATRTMGREHAVTADACMILARIALHQHDLEQGLRMAQEAVDIFEGVGAGVLERGLAYAGLAYAQCGPLSPCTPGTEPWRRGARTARRAQSLLEEAGPVAATSRTELVTWAEALLEP